MYFACNFEGQLYRDSSTTLCYSSAKGQVQRHIQEYLHSGTFDGKKLINDFFPKIEGFQVFISHSHTDAKIAIQLANILFEEFGIRSFIDSEVWDSIINLNKIIQNGEATHMMLAASLTAMMDQCSCVIFINTSHSIHTNKTGETVTSSPWLFYELATLHTLRMNSPVRRSLVKESSLESFSMMIDLPVPVKKLYHLNYDDIFEVGRKGFRGKPEAALNALHRHLQAKRAEE